MLLLPYQLLDDKEEVAAGQSVSLYRLGIVCAAVWRFVQVSIGSTGRTVQTMAYFYLILVKTGVHDSKTTVDEECYSLTRTGLLFI